MLPITYRLSENCSEENPLDTFKVEVSEQACLRYGSRGSFDDRKLIIVLGIGQLANDRRMIPFFCMCL